MSDEPRRLDRRDFLVRGGLLAGATTLAGAGGYVAARELARSKDDAQAAGSEAGKTDTRQFLLDPAYVNLTTFLLASHPRVVREAIERHRSGLDAGTALYLRQAEPIFEDEARDAAAEYLGTPA